MGQTGVERARAGEAGAAAEVAHPCYLHALHRTAEWRDALFRESWKPLSYNLKLETCALCPTCVEFIRCVSVAREEQSERSWRAREKISQPPQELIKFQQGKEKAEVKRDVLREVKRDVLSSSKRK